MSTVASYFSLNTGSTEREGETAVAIIHSNLFIFSNLQGVGFVDASGKPIAIPDPNKCPADIICFTFCSVVSAVAINDRAPDKILFNDFSPRLPQNLASVSPFTRLPVTATIAIPTVAHSPSLVSTIGFWLGNYTDKIMVALGVDNMRLLIDRSRTTLFSNLPSVVQPSILFSAPIPASKAIYYLFDS